MKKRLFLVSMAWFALLFTAGCPGSERRIFDRVAKKLRREPVISVYMADTGQKKRMGIEQYITGVVAGEMEKGWPINAYAAQAILVRTFTMEFLAGGGSRKQHGADISTEVEEAQAYNAAAITPEIRRAVKMTRGKVITSNRMYIKGWFSASCGGHTVPAKVGLAYKKPEPPYITPVGCPEDRVTPPPVKEWGATVTLDEIRAALMKMGRKVTAVTGIRPAGPKIYGRARDFEITIPGGKVKVPAADLRVALGADKMRSIWFTSFKTENGKVAMKGKGFGHGVGLCQWGAYAYAKSGRSPEQIIRHYYPKTRIMTVW
ncbi:MAG: SpoIID/LytB domain-containing protein [Bacillota bacterium]